MSFGNRSVFSPFFFWWNVRSFFLVYPCFISFAQKAFTSTLQHTSHCNTLQHTATHCDTLHNHDAFIVRHSATPATHWHTLEHIATHCNTLQHTATHYIITTLP